MKDYTQYFQKGVRSNGDHYFYLSDFSPSELRQLIYQIHHDCFYRCVHNDWIYEQLYYALQDLKKDEIEDITIEADIYNADLAKWFYENCNQYANELTSEMMADFGSGCQDAISLIGIAQHEAISRIYQAVNAFLKEGQNA